MKVLVDARMVGPSQRGIGRYIGELLKAMIPIDYGIEWTLITRPSSDSKYDPGPSVRTITTSVRWYTLAEQWVIPRIIWSQRPDAVHIPHFNVPILLSLGRLFGRGPRLVVTIHDLLLVTQPREHASTLPTPFWMIKYVGFSLSIWLALREADAIIAVSPQTGRQLEEHLPRRYWKRIHVIPEGPPLLPKATVDDGAPQRPYFLTIGSCYPHKNLQWVFEGISRLWKRGMGVTWVHIGPSEPIGKMFFETIRIQEQAQFQRDSRIIELGYVSDAELATWYAHAIATVFPSQSEGYGLPPVEALSCGGKIISTQVPSLEAVVAPQHQLRRIQTLEECIRAMEDAWNERERRAQAIRVGLNWHEVARQTLRLY